MTDDLEEYENGRDIKKVAKAARKLDTGQLISGIIDKKTFDEASAKSDKKIFIERNSFWQKKGKS